MPPKSKGPVAKGIGATGTGAKSPSAKGIGPASPFSADEEALLAEFSSDLDEFTAEIESPPPPLSSVPPSASRGKANDGATPFRSISAAAPVVPSAQSGSSTSASASSTSASSTSASSTSGVSAKPSPTASADAVEYATEYRVNCNICGSFLYAKANQAGKMIKCSDCFSPIIVPQPPKVKKKLKINLDEAETFALGESPNAGRRPDPYQKSADQLLEEAAREEEKNVDPKYDDTPSVQEWIKNVFGIFMDLGVLVHWIGLSVLATLPAVIALKLESPILIMGLFPAGFFLGVLTVSCGFAILHAVANEEESVSDWPTLDPFAWFGQLFVAVAAASLAAIPPWVLCQIVHRAGFDQHRDHDVLGVCVISVRVVIDVGHEQCFRTVFPRSGS